MKPKEAQSSVKSNDRAFEQVFDRQRNRVRGLWLRDDNYYARLDVDGITKRILLQGAQSVSEAETARQVLKNKIATGAYQAEQAKKLAPEVAPGTEAVDHSIKAAVLGYRSTRDKIGGLDSKTGDREDSGLNAWIEFAEKKKLAGLADIDTLACSDFAEWRRDEAWVLMRARIIVNALKKLKVSVPKRPVAPKTDPKADAEAKAKEYSKAFLEWEQVRAGIIANALKEKLVVEPKRPKKEEDILSGRTLDLDVQAIQKVIGWGVIHKWITKQPEIEWDTLAARPEDLRLLTDAELDACARPTW